MAHDNSLASLTEDWIITQLRAIQFGGIPLFQTDDVAAWEGTETTTAKAQADELLSAARNTSAKVLYAGDVAEDLEGTEIRTNATYAIYVALRNPRFPGAARRGDGTHPGANAVRELVRNALHAKRPNLTANGRYADFVMYESCEFFIHGRVGLIVEMRFTVHEVPAAA